MPPCQIPPPLPPLPPLVPLQRQPLHPEPQPPLPPPIAVRVPKELAPPWPPDVGGDEVPATPPEPTVTGTTWPGTTANEDEQIKPPAPPPPAVRSCVPPPPPPPATTRTLTDEMLAGTDQAVEPTDVTEVEPPRLQAVERF